MSVVLAASGHQQVRLRFTVSDTGIGIPMAARARLFEAFEQADNSLARRHSGTGLGTTIAKGLTEAMGGSIGFESSEHVGSRFWVELPFALPVAMARPIVEAASILQTENIPVPAEALNVIDFADPFLRHRARIKPLRVLIADDHAANRLLLQTLLQKAGHRVMAVDDGEAALEALASGGFDLALVDLHMPSISGIDLLRQLRVMEAGAHAATPVIVVSADAMADTVHACRSAGARAYITKPYTAGRLLEAIAEIAAADRPSESEPTVPQQQNNTTQILDATALDEFAALGMGKAFEIEFIGQCVTDARMALVRMRQAIAVADWEQYREQAHALKGVASNLGLQQCTALSSALMRMSGIELVRDGQRHCEALAECLRRGEQALAARGSWVPAREETP